MSIEVSGNVTAPQADRSHLDLTQPVAAGDFPANSTGDIALGDVRNTGNVNQTLAVSATNAQGCTVTGCGIVVNGNDEGATFELVPGQAAHVVAHISTPAEAIGSDPAPFSFEVDTVWS